MNPYQYQIELMKICAGILNSEKALQATKDQCQGILNTLLTVASTEANVMLKQSSSLVL